jgi:glycosyltransferase involved in cell wall biosynthesis
MPTCRILTNVSLTNHFPTEVSLTHFQFKKSRGTDKVWGTIRLLRMMAQVDAFVAFNPDIEEALVAFLNKYVLRRKSVTLFWDTNLQRPERLRRKIISRLKSVLFRGVDKFFCMHKDTTGYELYYRIPRAKFLYIPFKANNYDIIKRYETSDKGYILACGASLRDYGTFIRAAKQVGYPARIVLPDRKVASFHNTPLDECNLPANVEVIRHDFDRDSWNRNIAEARIVVVPILERALQPAGISVYLEAMALGKPVIVTDGASTRGMLTNEAEIVPPGDVTALAAALQKLWEHPDYREQLAVAGREYALSLGNEARLVKDILQNVIVSLSRST